MCRSFARCRSEPSSSGAISRIGRARVLSRMPMLAMTIRKERTASIWNSPLNSCSHLAEELRAGDSQEREEQALWERTEFCDASVLRRGWTEGFSQYD